MVVDCDVKPIFAVSLSRCFVDGHTFQSDDGDGDGDGDDGDGDDAG